MMRKNLLILAVIIMLPLSSCLRSILCIRGDGVIETERRRVTPFSGLANETSFDVIFKVSDTLGISIEGEQNILHYIETNVYDGCLEISTSPGSICLDYSIKPVIVVSAPKLGSVINSGSGDIIGDIMDSQEVMIKLTGSGDINIDQVLANSADMILSGSGNLKVEQLISQSSDMIVSGSGHIGMSGNCDDAHLKITGSGNINGRYFETTTASAIISGSGNLYINVGTYLNGLISGSGNIYLSGNPDIDQTITGSGRIIKYR